MYRAGQHAYALGRRYGPAVRRMYERARGFTARVNQRRTSAPVSRGGPASVRRSRRSYAGKRLPPGSRSIRSRARMPVGRSASKPISLKAVTDMIFPLLKEEYETPDTEIEWDANQQGQRTFEFLNRSKMEQLYNKVTSADCMGALAANTNLANTSQCMQYTGGYVEYTVLNSCNHTIEVIIQTMKPRRRHSQTIQDAWAQDLLEDNTVQNLVAPLNTERVMTTHGTDLIEANNPKSYVKFNWKVVKRTRKVLAVGETFTYRVNKGAFLYDKGIESMFQHHNISGNSYEYGPQTQCTHMICRSQLVTDTAGVAVAHGSGKVAVCHKETNFVRGAYRHKKYQTVNHGGLDYILAENQHHYNVETEAENVYNET